MFGILYLALACFIGYNLAVKIFPGLLSISCSKDPAGKSIKLERWMVVLPASFLTGTLLITWFTYIAAYAFHNTQKPMLYGNIISLSVFSAASIYFAYLKRDKCTCFIKETVRTGHSRIIVFFREHRLETVFILIALAMSSFLMFYTFNIKGNTMYIGLSVWGDFGPHLAVMRSFSLGSNFPTQYPHFADGNIRYHFLFQFLAGNLEFLGLRVDWAFNIPSILSMVSFFMLLYSFATIVTGKRWVGIITGILFFFRSSFAIFTFISSIKPLNGLIPRILKNDAYIGKTANENWGLWTQNVYINQRHLAFSLAILLLILIVMHPLFKKMIGALKLVRINTNHIRIWAGEFLLNLDAWLPEDIGRSVAIGVLLGLISFWNGAVVFAALPVLLFIAIFSKHRLEYLNIAVITVVLSLIQSTFFIGPESQAVNPQLYIGFLAARKDLYGILAYYVEMLGILPFILLAALFVIPKGMRWLTLAFLTPLIVATTIQLTPDINANHKFIIISVILLNIIAAYFLYRLFSSRKTVLIVAAGLLSLTMTVTGVVDFITLCNLNVRSRAVTAQTDDPIMIWVVKNTGPNEVFLTDVHVIHPILLAGRKIFYGWPYYAWSAGYDTYGREAIVNQIYGATSAKSLKGLVEENNISYIVIEAGNKNATVYKLNEKLIKDTFKLVYENTGRNIAIYRTY